MDGARKTAVLLLSLDQTVAATLLRRLPREQVEQVTLAIASAENVTREEQEQVLNEFKVAFANRPLIQPLGPETARELLEKSLDQADVEPTETRLDEMIYAGPFAFLHDRHADDIRRLIECEHVQTIAVIAAQLPPDLAAQILNGFAPDLQADILARLARLGPADAGLLEEIAGLLKERIGPVPVRKGGVLNAAEVLRETTRTTSRSILDSIHRKDAALGDLIEGSLFPFEDIIAFDDATWRIVFEKTYQCRWGIALKGTSETLRQRVLQSLPDRLAKALIEQMNSAGPIRLSEITGARSEIIEMILALEAAQLVTLPKNTTRPRRLRRIAPLASSEAQQHEKLKART
jgi:flagellar motor switch protein FliG